MRLEWFKHSFSDDGEMTLRSFLVDMETDRVHGYIDHPGADMFCFNARPYHQADRFYTTETSAKAYVEASAFKDIQEDLKDDLGAKVLQPESDALPKAESPVESMVKADQ